MISRCQQGSDEWVALRVGRITASRIVDVLSFNQPSAAQAKDAGFKLVAQAMAAGIVGKESGARSEYRWELAAERLTGQPRETTAAYAKRVQWGTEHEPHARGLYEVEAGVMVDRIGFITHPDMDYAGGSPDALVGGHGVLEIKCPDTITHLKWMEAGVVPEEHEPQCMFNIACGECDWCDFMSYDPRLPEDLRKFIVRLPRDEKRIAHIEREVKVFHESIEDLIGSLRHPISRVHCPISLNDKLRASLELVPA